MATLRYSRHHVTYTKEYPTVNDALTAALWQWELEQGYPLEIIDDGKVVMNHESIHKAFFDSQT